MTVFARLSTSLVTVNLNLVGPDLAKHEGEFNSNKKQLILTHISYTAQILVTGEDAFGIRTQFDSHYLVLGHTSMQQQEQINNLVPRGRTCNERSRFTDFVLRKTSCGATNLDIVDIIIIIMWLQCINELTAL